MAITIRLMQEADLDEADRIFRLAFGTFMGVRDPLSFGGDTDYVRTRWRADPDAAFAAVQGRELVGSNFAAHWGSFGYFGPLSVRPDLWDQGVARRLLDATMERFAAWRITHAGLYTFANSPKHIGLYQRYGFYPRFLTAILQKPVSAAANLPAAERFSALPRDRRAACLDACRGLTGAIFAGLDVAHEIRAVQDQRLGDTLLVWNGGELDALAVCHAGAGTEAGSQTAYIKFAAVRPGAAAAETFVRLLGSSERFAAERGDVALTAGVNTARHHAYRGLLAYGFRSYIQGVAMQRPNDPGFNREDVFIIDDWR
jgi:ribosomal protein S18 acetylase RimI-like enzyme